MDKPALRTLAITLLVTANAGMIGVAVALLAGTSWGVAAGFAACGLWGMALAILSRENAPKANQTQKTANQEPRPRQTFGPNEAEEILTAFLKENG